MRISTGMVSKTSILMLFVACLVFAEQEEKINFERLPAAVRETAKQQSKGATVRGYAREIENGKTYYEVELLLNGKTKDLLVDPSGAVVEVEQEVDFETLDNPVKTGLRKQTAQGKILKVEKVTRGSQISYEAVALIHGNRREIAVSSAGIAKKPD